MFDKLLRENSEHKWFKQEYILCAIWLLGFFLLFSYLYQYLSYAIDSDTASEMVLSKMLSESNQLLTKDWYYSTELRVFNTQLVYASLFKFMDNWHDVRFVGNLILSIFLVFAVYFWLGYGELKKYLHATLILLFVPVIWRNSGIMWHNGGMYYTMFFTGAFYIIHLIFTLLLFGLYNRYINRQNYIYLIIATIISFLSSLDGLREIFVFHLPLLIACFFEYFCGKKESLNLNKFTLKLFFVFANLIAAGLGNYINSSILRKSYTFMNHNNIKFADFSLAKIGLIFNGYITNLGYQGERKLFSEAILYNSLSIIIFCILIYGIYYTIKRSENRELRFLSFFALGMFITHVGIYGFTNMTFEDRYILQNFICVFPLIVYGIFDLWQKKDCVIRSLMALITLIAIINVFNFYRIEIKKEYSKMHKEVVYTLVKNNYLNGYATFVNSNVLTELSNGAIEVWDFKEHPDKKINNNRIHKWLQKKSHEKQKPQGKVFMFFTNEELKKNFSSTSINKRFILKQTPKYTIYGFDSIDIMQKHISTQGASR